MSDHASHDQPTAPPGAEQHADLLAGHRVEGSRAGTTDGTATHVTGVIGRAEPFPDKPRASIVLDDATAKIVAFEFAEGQVLGDHAAHHPVLIQVLRGRVEFGLPDRTLDLGPGEFVHLTPKLRHSVRALEPTTLTVTMLLPHD